MNQLFPLAIVCCLIVSASSHAQSKISEKQFRDEILMNEIISLPNNQTICTELDIVDTQIARIRNTTKSYIEKSTSIVDQFRLDEAKIKLASSSKNPLELAKLKEKLRKDIAELQKKVTNELEDILLAHQFSRIKQIAIQKQIKLTMAGQDGLQVILILARELKMNPGELKKLQEHITEVSKERDEVIAKANRKAENKVLSILTPEQRSLIRKKIGDLYFD